MDSIVEQIASSVSSVDEIGVVFENHENLIIVENKMGLTPKLIVKLHQYLKTQPETPNKWLVRVICNGDDYTSWSRRKSVLHSIDEELKITALILSKQPKSHGAWEHRMFVCNMVENKTEAFLMQEIALCERTCTRHTRTYFAWRHRAWACSWMNSALLYKERAAIKAWMSKHMMDASAAHHYTVVHRLLADRDVDLCLNAVKRVNVLLEDLQWCSGLMLQSEATWQVRKYVVHQLLFELSQGGGSVDYTAWRTVDFDASLAHEERFSTYAWFAKLHHSNVNADFVLQVLFDECAEAIRGGNKSRGVAVWLIAELLAIMPNVVSYVLVEEDEEECECAELVHKLVYQQQGKECAASDITMAFEFAHKFEDMVARFDAIEFTGLSLETTRCAPQDSLQHFTKWLYNMRSERQHMRSIDANKYYHVLRNKLAMLSSLK